MSEGRDTFTTLSAMKNRRLPAIARNQRKTRTTAKPHRGSNATDRKPERSDRRKRRRRALDLDLCGIPTAPPSRCRAWDGRMRIDPANQVRRTAEKERTTRPVAGSVRRHQDAPTQDNQKRERPRAGKPGNRGALFLFSSGNQTAPRYNPNSRRRSPQA